MTALLNVEHLSVRFAAGSRRPVQAVDDVSFSVNRGEVFAIVGESGCGKTTALLAIVGLLGEAHQVTGGSIYFGQRDLLSISRAELNSVRGKEIGVIFQEPMTALNPVMRIGEQVEEVVRRHARLTGEGAKKRVVELLEIVGIPEPERRVREYAHELSGGMAQRVVIAMAIACGPSLLLADEPTTALDVTIQAGILRMLAELRAKLGMAVVLVTHDFGVVAAAADRVMVMYAGRKVEEAPVEELFTHPWHPYTAGVLGAVRKMGEQSEKRLQEIPGFVPTLAAPAASCSFAPRCQSADQRCLGAVPSLEPAGELHQAACFHPLGQAR